MNTKITLLSFFLLFSILSHAQKTYVPDNNFEQALIDLGYDDVLDDYVITSNISGITYLNVKDKDISDLTGIEGFKKLETLYCYENQLTSLNISQNTVLVNLSCHNNQLTNLDVSQNTVLETLACVSNQLVSLDISKNTALTSLQCGNNQITSLDIRNNVDLIQLSCQVNKITSLDLSNNTDLEGLWCIENPINSLDVSNNMALTNLGINNTQVTILDIRQNTSLIRLDCFGVQLTSLDVNNNTALEHLELRGTKIRSLNLSKNTALTIFRCSSDQLESLNVRNGNNSILTEFVTYGTPLLTCIDVDDASAANAGTGVYADWKKVATASYSEDCRAVTSTSVPDNNFEQALIDLGYDDVLDDYVLTSNISGVTSLDVGNKSISELTGIEDFISLTELDCRYNQLTSIDVSQNTTLTYLACYENQLTSLDVSQNTALTRLRCGSNSLTSLDLSQNTALTHLYCSGNQFITLDLSQNTALKELYCTSNQIQILNLDQNILLEYLFCSENQIQNLDVSQKTALIKLSCEDNQIQSLDLSQNTNLEDLRCNNNNLESLNVRNGNNSLIFELDATNNTLLKCIEVDDANAANAGTGVYASWEKDATTFYSEDCKSALSIDDELLAKGLNLYPNPVTNILTIDSEIQLTKVEICSMLGEKVNEINTGFNAIPLNNLSSGIYIIRILSEKGSTTKKLIKN